MKRIFFFTVAVAFAALFAFPVVPEASQGTETQTVQRPGKGKGKGRRGNRKPPQAALDACNGLSEGDACSFNNRRNEPMEGTCFVPPRDSDVLVCRPDNMRGRNR